MLLFLQKAALEKRNKELKEWQDKQKGPGVEKMVSLARFLLGVYLDYICLILKHLDYLDLVLRLIAPSVPSDRTLSDEFFCVANGNLINNASISCNLRRL